jgi:predicted DNA-binding protein
MTVMARKKEEAKPVQAAEPETKSVRLDLDIEAHQRLRIAAAKRGKPMAVVVRELVEEFLEKEPQ